LLSTRKFVHRLLISLAANMHNGFAPEQLTTENPEDLTTENSETTERMHKRIRNNHRVFSLSFFISVLSVTSVVHLSVPNVPGWGNTSVPESPYLLKTTSHRE
jgi:hypothetical protein